MEKDSLQPEIEFTWRIQDHACGCFQWAQRRRKQAAATLLVWEFHWNQPWGLVPPRCLHASWLSCAWFSLIRFGHEHRGRWWRPIVNYLYIYAVPQQRQDPTAPYLLQDFNLVQWPFQISQDTKRNGLDCYVPICISALVDLYVRKPSQCIGKSRSFRLRLWYDYIKRYSSMRCWPLYSLLEINTVVLLLQTRSDSNFWSMTYQGLHACSSPHLYLNALLNRLICPALPLTATLLEWRLEQCAASWQSLSTTLATKSHWGSWQFHQK